MKSIILVVSLLLLSGVTYGQKIKMKIDPKKTKLKMPQTQPATNGVQSAEGSRKRPGGTAQPKSSKTDRKRPGGTISTKPTSTNNKTEGTKPKPVPKATGKKK